MATKREELIADLEHLVHHAGAREVYLRLDDAGLAAAVERLKARAEQSRSAGGSLSPDDFGLRTSSSIH